MKTGESPKGCRLFGDNRGEARNRLYRLRAAPGASQPLAILQRGHHLARVLCEHLPANFEHAIWISLRSLTAPLTRTDDLGLAVFFYLPHVASLTQPGSTLTFNRK
jgi:hypothetical protein